MAWCLHDNQYLFAWAIQDARDQTVLLLDQVKWLANVLGSRGFPLERLARNLEIAADVARQSTELAGLSAATGQALSEAARLEHLSASPGLPLALQLLVHGRLAAGLVRGLEYTEQLGDPTNQKALLIDLYPRACRRGEDDVIARGDGHPHAGSFPPVEALPDGEDDAVLRRRLRGSRRDDQPGASHPVRFELFDDDLVENRFEDVARHTPEATSLAPLPPYVRCPAQ